MANYVDNIIINESESTLTVRTFIRSDNSGELINTPVVAASELNPPLGPGQYMSIYEMWYQLTNFTVQFSWATLTVPEPFWCAVPSTDSKQDFKAFGGLIDSSGMYARGVLLMTTTGFAGPASYGSFVFRMRKHANTTPNYKNVGIPLGIPPNEFILPN
jgi:hypothetical protein